MQQREGIRLVVVGRVKLTEHRFVHHLFFGGVAFAGPELLDLTDADADGPRELPFQAPHLEGRQHPTINVRGVGAEVAADIFVEYLQLWLWAIERRRAAEMVGAEAMKRPHEPPVTFPLGLPPLGCTVPGA